MTRVTASPEALYSKPRRCANRVGPMSDYDLDYGDGPQEPPRQIRPEPRACPDCEQGKHRNCDGVTWDNEADDFTKCPCAEAGHKS